MFERFTDRAQKVMALANQEAQRFDHEYIGTEHILLGLVKEGSGIGGRVLAGLGLNLRKVRLEVEKLVKSGPVTALVGKLPQTPRAKKVIEYAIEEARNLNHNYVGTEHLLLGLLREQDGVAAQVLMNLELKLKGVREEVLKLLSGFESGNRGSNAPVDLPKETDSSGVVIQRFRVPVLGLSVDVFCVEVPGTGGAGAWKEILLSEREVKIFLLALKVAGVAPAFIPRIPTFDQAELLPSSP